MFFLTPVGILILAALFFIRRRVHRFAYHRPNEVNVQALSCFVDRAFFGLLLWVGIAMVLDYRDAKSLLAESDQIQRNEQP